ncbi:hypothetical protein [Acholeplasma granularum]|uniref:hypothetical protein n=1 Tax=Acholeplasma granularum TaxID=264635 RepID=UPI000471C808|nr:hypothetical protein [Acholeplasma granularum]
MYSSIDIIKALDKIRTKNKLTIQEFVSGVMSRKKYTRISNNEADITLLEVSKLLSKVGIPLQEFAIFTANIIETANHNETSFYMSCIHGNYETAYKQHLPNFNLNNLKTTLGNKAVHAIYELMQYKLNFQSLQESSHKLRMKMDLKELIKDKILTDSTIGALYAYVHLGTDIERRQISKYLYDAIFDSSYKYYLLFNEISRSILQITAILSLTLLSDIKKEEIKTLESIIKYTFEFHTRSRLSIMDYNIFKVLNDFQNKNNLLNEYIVYYYISSYITIYQKEDVEPFIMVKEDDLNIYKKYLKDSSFTSGRMYERLLSDDKIW